MQDCCLGAGPNEELIVSRRRILILEKEDKIMMILEIKDLVKQNGALVTKGYELMVGREISGINELLEFLLELFRLEELEIENQHNKTYVTDDYENGVRRFAIELVQIFDKYDAFDDLENRENFTKLLSQKHVAYGFFSALNDGKIQRSYEYYLPEHTVEQIGNKIVLYEGLLKFYSDFYGSFYDNEEAIELICQYNYFLPENEQSDYIKEISLALLSHIKMAGTPNDIGYAYKGIDKIKTYIKNISIDTINELLKNYQLYQILNNSVYRNQIYTIIEYSKLEISEKYKYKFWYLDSLFIANQINKFLPEKLREKRVEYNLFINYYDLDLSNDKIEVFETPYSFWNNSLNSIRKFYYEGDLQIEIELKDNNISIQYERFTKEIEFKYNDWLLNSFKEKEIIGSIRSLIFNQNNLDSNLYSKKITFSMLYLNNYRGVNGKTINFDHKYETLLKPENKQLINVEKQNKKFTNIPYFYGKDIYSLSCIVGQNGTGKTSIIDFLRETFFKMIILINESKINCEKGFIKEEDYSDYGILDSKSEFFIIFNIGEDSYYLSNIETDKPKISNIKFYQKNIFSNLNNSIKIVYFSNMLRGDYNFFVHQYEALYDEEKIKRKEFSRVFDTYQQTDFSETNSFITKIKNIDSYNKSDNDSNNKLVNKEICYQMTFLRNLTQDELNKYFEYNENEIFYIKSQLFANDMSFTIKELQEDTERIRKLEEKFLKLPDARLQHFSSGQYAKFSFLAKLYWFIEGYYKDTNRYSKIFGDNVFSNENAILDDETALIFIDEGELYYHPEWQRKYIKTLLDIVEMGSTNSKLQIIVTTNSPFILSDILKEDVTYLLNEKKENEEEEEEEIYNTRTLGQNIHTLLKNNFFMKYTIGEYSNELINKIMSCLLLDKDQNRVDKEKVLNIQEVCELYFGENSNNLDSIALLIDQIGEPIYRKQLTRLLEESSMFKKEKSINELEEEKRKLEEQIKILRGKKNIDKN